MNVLGIHAGHDASASLLRGNQVIAAIEEERLVRIKQVSTFPVRAIAEVLRIGGLRPSDVDYVALSGEAFHRELPYPHLLGRLGKLSPVKRQLYNGVAVLSYLSGSEKLRARIYDSERFWLAVHKKLHELGLGHAKVSRHDHHLCHAASAYYVSPFDTADVFTLDGKGDFASGMHAVGSRGELRVMQRLSHLNSVGQFYSAITRYLGFRPNRHEGKITGLAAFADPEPLATQFRQIFSVHRNGGGPGLERSFPIVPSDKAGRRRLLLDSFDSLKMRVAVANNDPENLAYELAAAALQDWLAEVCASYEPAQVAAAAQRVTEEVVAAWIDQSIGAREADVCLAGGVFSNVKVNQRILELASVRNVFVQPAMGDSGLSLGAALLARARQAQPQTTTAIRDVYLGPQFDDAQIEQELANWRNQFAWQRLEQIEDYCGEAIHTGRIVGRFNGRLEWGPRALGNRSLLVRPSDKSINNSLNARLKRTEFMPFAPSVLDYRAADYFVGYRPDHVASEYMTITYDVYEERQAEIEAVVHVDGTARPQVVRADVNPSYYRILQAFEQRSGTGLFVNTSFNMHEEPIVGTPYDALRALDLGSCDVLAIGNWAVEPRR